MSARRSASRPPGDCLDKSDATQLLPTLGKTSAMLTRRDFLATLAVLLWQPTSSLSAHTRSLRLVIDEWPPYEFTRGNSVDGYAVAMTEAVLKQMGYGLQRPDGAAPGARALAMIESGAADVAVSALWSAERARIGRFPQEPLFDARYAIFGTRPSTLVLKQASDFASLRLGIVHGFLYPDGFLASLPASTKVIASYDAPSNLQSLYLGHVDAVIENARTAPLLIQQRQWQDHIDPTPLMQLSPLRFFALFSPQTVPQGLVDEFSKRLAHFKHSTAGQRLAALYQLTP